MIILSDKGDEQKVIEEEKQEWLTNVLLAMGVPVEAFELEMDDLKYYLSSVDIEVWDNYNGTIDIYKDDEIVGQWNQPELIIIKDAPNKWHYEIHINAWARSLQNQGEG